MDSTDLYYFRTVAEVGGVREAAKHLNIAPSAISRRITRLEAQLGTRLLDRTRTGTALTATGRRCLTYAHEVHAAKQQLLKDLQAVQQLQSGQVYLHCTEGQLEFLSRAVTDFQQQYPKISFDLKVGSAQAILSSVESGTADLGISFSPLLHSPLESAVQFAAPLLAVVDPAHPLAKRKSVSLEDLNGQSLALPPAGFALRRIYDQQIRKKQLQQHISLCTDSIGAMKAFVRNHGGVTILSYMSITSELKAEMLVAIPFIEPEMSSTTIEIFALGRRRLPPAVATFLRYLRIHAAPQMLSQWMAPSPVQN